MPTVFEHEKKYSNPVLNKLGIELFLVARDNIWKKEKEGALDPDLDLNRMDAYEIF